MFSSSGPDTDHAKGYPLTEIRLVYRYLTTPGGGWVGGWVDASCL